MVSQRRMKVLLCGMLLAGGGPVIAGDSDQQGLMARGAQLLSPFKKELRSALQAGLAKGPDAAVAACHAQAPGITAQYARDGVRIGRSSHRLRNLANAPEPWLAPVLDAYLASETAPAPQLLRLDDGRVGYVEPILLKAPCLLCHGETLAPGVAQRIETLYPNDEATGFSLGELRGVFWVEYPET
ncbi:MAG: DUF3365 domain-containing protein [Pseudomonadota bacterium]